MLTHTASQCTVHLYLSLCQHQAAAAAEAPKAIAAEAAAVTSKHVNALKTKSLSKNQCNRIKEAS